MPRKRVKKTPEEISRSNSQNGKKARAASPWNRYPMANTKNAKRSHVLFLQRSHGITPTDNFEPTPRED